MYFYVLFKFFYAVNDRLSPTITNFTYHIFLQVSRFLCLLESQAGRPKWRGEPNPWCHWVLQLRIINFIASAAQSTSTPRPTGHKPSLHYFYSRSLQYHNRKRTKAEGTAKCFVPLKEKEIVSNSLKHQMHPAMINKPSIVVCLVK